VEKSGKDIDPLALQMVKAATDPNRAGHPRQPRVFSYPAPNSCGLPFLGASLVRRYIRCNCQF
jgi:hypothetical protein